MPGSRHPTILQRTTTGGSYVGPLEPVGGDAQQQTGFHTSSTFAVLHRHTSSRTETAAFVAVATPALPAQSASAAFPSVYMVLEALHEHPPVNADGAVG